MDFDLSDRPGEVKYAKIPTAYSLSESEKWAFVLGYEGKYMVSTHGRRKVLFSMRKSVDKKNRPTYGKKEKIANGRITPKGYSIISLSKDNKILLKMLHVKVTESFIGLKPTPSHQVNHKDGVKHHNWSSNLEWNTPSENLKHAFAIGLKSHKGAKCPMAKLTEGQVKEIRTELGGRGTNREYKKLMGKYNVSLSTIRHAAIGFTYANVI